jgi:hypothetical protein
MSLHDHAMDENQVTLDYVSVGGNRHPAAADWDRQKSGLLAFGADNNVALWDPLVGHCFSFRYWLLGLHFRIRDTC